MASLYHILCLCLCLVGIILCEQGGIGPFFGADALSSSSPSKKEGNVVSRRKWLLSQVVVAGGSCGWLAGSSSSFAATENPNNELPLFLRDYTKLAPLGRANGGKSSSDKTLGLSLDELTARLTKDLTLGATGQGGYFLTGDLSRDIFREDAVFTDPTNRVSSVSQYQRALRILFDPEHSTVELVRPLVIEKDKDTRTITGRIRSRGYLQLPWKPYVTAYESTIVYTVDESGLISRQDQTWSKAASKALHESFTPSFVDPPPRSTCAAPVSEPRPVSRLFEILNGRRPYEYSPEEKEEIDQLVSKIMVLAASSSSADSGGSSTDFDQSLFPGTWMLAYIQPGPDGTGIDRRIPFPEFDFNDNFQVFGKDSTVVNVGQVLGPSVAVKVFGTLQEDDPDSIRVPKRFRANIQGGKLCAFRNNCIGLPIQGEGLFDSLYLGDRLRIGQNLNGGGARVVQIRLDDDISVV
jgi:hypothetical protein